MPQGTVKWFNNAKGYGFIIEDGETEDLFAHFSSIQMDGYKTLKAGQIVQFEKQPADKGFHAVSITSAETISPASQPSAHNVDHDEFISVEEPSIEDYRADQQAQIETEKTQETASVDKTVSA